MTGTNLQGTNIISMIVPTHHADTYATHDSFYGKGGWREVDTLDARNNIPEERRRIGMVVYVRETFKAYLLKNSLSNAGWVPFNIDGEEYVTEDEMNAAIEEALEDYPTKAEVQETLGDYATQQWVIDYIGDIDLTDYQKKTDNNLQTTNKTIVGAINELNSKPHIDTYSKAEEDALLAEKADKVTTYTKTEVDNIIENLPIPEDVYTKEETDELLEGKAAVGDAYTKVESDAKYLTEHQDISGKVDKEITSAAGKALIFNESDGGGAKFEGATRNSFAGVNDMTDPNGLGVQLYNINKTTKVGPRINLTADRATYSIDRTEVGADYELLIKKDLDNYYGKEAVDTLLADKANVGDSYTKAEIDEIIEDLPISENVYTKDETDALLTGKIDKYATLPTEGIEVGTIVQYTGKTTGPYTRGYFYKYMGETGIEFTPIQNEGAPECTTVATISVEDLTALLDTICEDRPFKAKDIVRGQIGYHNITSVYSFSATTDDGRFFSITYPIADLQEAGFTFEPLLGPGQGLKFTCNLNGTAWVQTDVQPSPSVEEIAALVEESDVFVPTDEYEQKCAQYEADIAALQEENEALQETVETLTTTVETMQTTLDYVYEIVTQPHYDVLPDEEP